jgi:hypothetical protein
MLQLRPLAELLAETNPQLVRLLEHCRQQPEHLQPRTWTEGDRATARRILADQLAEPLADYGPALVLDALHSALVVDMVDMLPHAIGETAAHLTRLADALQALAQAADLHEASHAR